ncbi:MAG: vitamin K epoxide reductase family protein [Gemmatimonadales bacterium]
MRYRMSAAVLSLAGVFLSTYLYLYKTGRIGTLACGTGSCEFVQFSSWSSFLGLDVSLIGIAGYLVLFGLSLGTLRWPAGERGWPSLALLLLTLGGVLFTAYLTSIELFVLHAICRWCVGSAVIISLLFVAALLDWRQAKP